MFSFDQVIEDISGTGRYQNLLIFIVLSCSVSSGFVMVLPVFLAATPVTRCRLEPHDNHTLFPNVTNNIINQVFIPWNSLTKNYDSCSMKVYNISDDSASVLESLFNQTAISEISCPNGYVYDHSIFENTIITEWDLVCNKRILAAMSSSLYYTGVFFGSVIGGVLSDRFGRVVIFRISTLCSLLCGCGVAFSPNIYVFSALRFSLGVTYFPIIVSGFTYVAEISKKKWRTVVGMMFNAIFGLACIVLSGIAYAFRSWRSLQIAASVIGFAPLFVVSWLLPKSPRWLCVQGRMDEAKRVCEKMARHNNTKLSEEIWLETEEHFRNSAKQQDSYANFTVETRGKKFDILRQFIREPYTRYMICGNMCVWMVTCLVYYGLVLNSGSLAGNVYINNAAGGLMEFLACSLAIPCIALIGFTKTTASSLFFASGACLISTVIGQLDENNTGLQTFATVLAMCGRFGSSFAFGTIYLHTVEMFPTSGRTTALGLSSMAARAGSIFSPFTVTLQLTIPWLTPTIFGVTALLAAIISTTFPDTRNKELTATFVEAESAFYEHLKNSIVSRMFCLPKRRTIKEEDEVPFTSKDSK